MIKSFLKFLLLATLVTVTSSALAARDDEPLDESDEVTEEDLKIVDIPVDQRIFQVPWHNVPYDKTFFTYSDKEIEQKWEYLMRGLLFPFPSADFLKTYLNKYPELVEGIEGIKPLDQMTDADYDTLQQRYMETWRLFFAGDFQRSREMGLKLGPIGLIPAQFSTLLYAIYLTDRQSVKYMMLQEVANVAQDHFDIVDKIAEDENHKVRALGAAIRLAYAYAIARIAEETPVPVVVARRYIGKIRKNSDIVLDIFPNHPLGLAFNAGVDAGIMRRVGKFTGRMTYGARTTNVHESFEGALQEVDDIPIVYYEYGNALIYMNKKRDLTDALKYLQKATQLSPQFSMDALDTMYAYKRLQEIRIYAKEYRSFRKFEKYRRKFSKITDRNLTNVLTPPITVEMLENPEKYILPKLP